MIPVEVEDITAAWLEDVLRRHARARPSRASEVAEAHSGTTGRARVLLTHDDPRLPRSVFVKLAPFDAGQRAFVEQLGMGLDRGPLLRRDRSGGAGAPSRVPGTRRTTTPGATSWCSRTCSRSARATPSQRDPDLPAFVERTIDAFAALHAAFWASPRFAPDGDLAWVERRSRGYGSAAPFVSFAVEQLGAQPAGRVAPAGRGLPARAPTGSPRCSRTARPTLVHGDAHLGNMFVDGTTPGFLKKTRWGRSVSHWDGGGGVLCSSVGSGRSGVTLAAATRPAS